MTTTPTATISTEIAELGGVTGTRGNALREALERIARWHGEFPETGKTWPDGTPTSYSAEYGSNGERDYMRQVAINALAAPVAPEPAAAQDYALNPLEYMPAMGIRLAYYVRHPDGSHSLADPQPTLLKPEFRNAPQPLAEVSAAQVVPEWMPIETAPQDGRTLLLGRFNEYGKWRTMRGQWFTKEEIDQDWEETDGFEAGWHETAEESDYPNCWAIAPTHWQPTPPAPVAQPTDTTRKA